MGEAEKEPLTESESVEQASEKSQPKVPGKGFKENLYDKIPLTVKQLDIIIFLLLVAFVVFFIIGALKGNGIL